MQNGIDFEYDSDKKNFSFYATVVLLTASFYDVMQRSLTLNVFVLFSFVFLLLYHVICVHIYTYGENFHNST